MEIKLKKSNLIIAILFLSFNYSFGQWSFKLATNQSYSNNPFYSPVPISSMVSSFELGIEGEFDAFNFGYYGNYSLFQNINYRNFYWQQVGIWDSTDDFMFGLYLENRTNKLDFEYYNYTNYNAYIKYQAPVESINIFSNASFSLTDYSYLNDLDNILTNIGITLNKSFETKTTLIGSINFNYKNYFDTNLNSNDLVGDSLSSPNSKAFTSQFNFYGRIAQSLTESTGLAIFYLNKSIVGGTANYIRNLEYVYGDESQYFDDPISYQGNFVGTQLTQLLPMGIILRAIYTIESKGYPSQGIYSDSETFNQNIVRNDDQTSFSISLTKNIFLDDEFEKKLVLGLSFEKINNNSNSYWYDFNSTSLNLNLNFQF